VKELTKYVGMTLITRFLMYIVVSVLGFSVVHSETVSIRNELYGIGDYINVDAVTGMLSALNVVFLFILVLFLFATKKHLYTKANIKSEYFSEYVKFEAIVELSVTLGYVVISAIASVFVKDLCVVAGLVVPVYFLYFLTENLFVATVLTSIAYIALIFVILILPALKLKSKKR